MKTVIKRDNDQLVVVIPREVAAQANLGPGNEVEVSAALGKIVIRATGTPNYTLADLVAQITDENRHELID